MYALLLTCRQRRWPLARAGASAVISEYARGMAASRVTITLPEELRHAIASAADRASKRFSAVVPDALATWTRGQLVDAWLAEYQTENGEFSEDELKTLATEAGVPYIPPGPARLGRARWRHEAGARRWCLDRNRP